MKLGLLRPEHLVDVKTIPGLNAIVCDDDMLAIGAAVTHAQVEHSVEVRERVPILVEVESRVGNPRVRSAGTLAGNLCFAEPRSDVATVLLTLDARCIAGSRAGTRRFPVSELLADAYSSSLAHDEVLTAIEVPVPEVGWAFGYRKFQFHVRPALAVALGLRLEGGEVVGSRLAVASAPEAPTRCPTAEAALRGSLERVRAKSVEIAAAAATDSALGDDDEFGGEYKAHLLGIALRDLLRGLAAA